MLLNLLASLLLVPCFLSGLLSDDSDETETNILVDKKWDDNPEFLAQFKQAAPGLAFICTHLHTEVPPKYGVNEDTTLKGEVLSTGEEEWADKNIHFIDVKFYDVGEANPDLLHHIYKVIQPNDYENYQIGSKEETESSFKDEDGVEEHIEIPSWKVNAKHIEIRQPTEQDAADKSAETREVIQELKEEIQDGIGQLTEPNKPESSKEEHTESPWMLLRNIPDEDGIFPEPKWDCLVTGTICNDYDCHAIDMDLLPTESLYEDDAHEKPKDRYTMEGGASGAKVLCRSYQERFPMMYGIVDAGDGVAKLAKLMYHQEHDLRPGKKGGWHIEVMHIPPRSEKRSGRCELAKKACNEYLRLCHEETFGNG